MCLNILRDDWKPIMNLNQVILGLQVQPCGYNPGHLRTARRSLSAL